MANERGIIAAALTQQATVVYATTPVDDVGLMANLSALQTVANDISTCSQPPHAAATPRRAGG